MAAPNQKSLYEQLGGRRTLERVHKLFYDRAYEHPWLGKFFAEIDQKHIEKQQTDFVAAAMGGPKLYCGSMVNAAHQRMLITEELFDLRHELLANAIGEVKVPAPLAARWLKLDAAFKGKMCKSSAADCKKRYFSDRLLLFTNR